MSSLFICLFHTRYNSQILRAFYTQFTISYKFMAIALSVNAQNNHGTINKCNIYQAHVKIDEFFNIRTVIGGDPKMKFLRLFCPPSAHSSDHKNFS